MKQASLIVVGFLMLLSCQTGSISRKLTEVDSLVFKEEYDSGYLMISSIDETTIKNQEDQAHYNLLKVQTGYLANKPAASPDSLLDEVTCLIKSSTIIKRRATLRNWQMRFTIKQSQIIIRKNSKVQYLF